MSITKKNYIWNLIYSFVNAAQSMLLMLLVNRIINEDASGVFSYAFSVAVLFMYIGNFGIRNYQVSDIKEKYKIKDYYGFRILSCATMLVASLLFVLIKHPDYTKTVALLALCGWRLAESMEDVFHGRYQQKGALYLGCMQGTIRLAASDVAFLVALYICRDLKGSCIVFCVANTALIIIFALLTLSKYGGFKIGFKLDKLKGIFIECLPLFLGYFLSTYLCNVCKYSLERHVSNEIQAYYNMVFMPVLVINLLSTVIFRPLIVDMANLYNDNKLKDYKKIINKQQLYILLIAVVIMPCVYFLGIPVLSVFYDSKLGPYRLILMILMLGGIFSAYSSFINVCIITIRKQNILIIATVIIALIAAGLTEIMVIKFELLGAALSYLIVMILQAVAYLLIHEISLKKKANSLVKE